MPSLIAPTPAPRLIAPTLAPRAMAPASLGDLATDPDEDICRYSLITDTFTDSSPDINDLTDGSSDSDDMSGSTAISDRDSGNGKGKGKTDGTSECG